MIYDIIYSIPCHESPDCVVDQVHNLIRASRELRILVVLNFNNILYDLYAQDAGGFRSNLMDTGVVCLNKEHPDKGYMSSDILKAHISNFTFVKEHSCKYFCTLASNCMMISPIELERIDALYSGVDIDIPRKFPSMEYSYPNNWFHWTKFKYNVKIVERFKAAGIQPVNGTIDGRIYDSRMFAAIVSSICEYKLLEDIELECVFEEILPPSLSKTLYNFNVPQICHIYWEQPNYEPPIDLVKRQIAHNLENEDSIKFAIKRVPREFDNSLRTFIREELEF